MIQSNSRISLHGHNLTFRLEKKKNLERISISIFFHLINNICSCSSFIEYKICLHLTPKVHFSARRLAKALALSFRFFFFIFGISLQSACTCTDF